MSAFGRNFLPGPTDVHPEVLAALAGPMFPHRGERMRALLAAADGPLRKSFGTARPVFISTSSATGLLEAAIRNGVRRRVLVAVGGYFGEYFARIAESCGKQAIRVEVHPGAAVTPEQLEHFLDGPPVDAVAVVHSESSTGALADIAGLARVLRTREDVLLLVDGVTAVGAREVEMDAWGADWYCTGSQKAYALPPGLAFGVASERFVARAEAQPDAGFYFGVRKLAAIASEGVPFWTPAVSLLLALERQLERIAAEGGWPARWARHRELLATMERWVARRDDVSLLAGPGQRSPAISALRLPETHPAGAMIPALAARGWLVGGALHPRHGNLIRIGHMGDLQPAHLTALLAQLEELLR